MSKAKHPHGGTPALVALEQAGVTHTMVTYTHDADSGLPFGTEAAQRTGLSSEEMFKTLVVRADGLVVAIVPVDHHVDLKALAHAVGAKKAEMAPPAEAERATGYVVGGISPLGQKRRLRTVLDDSALGKELIYVSGGRRGMSIGLAPGDLVRLTSATTAPIARTATHRP